MSIPLRPLFILVSLVCLVSGFVYTDYKHSIGSPLPCAGLPSNSSAFICFWVCCNWTWLCVRLATGKRSRVVYQASPRQELDSALSYLRALCHCTARYIVMSACIGLCHLSRKSSPQSLCSEVEKYGFLESTRTKINLLYRLRRQKHILLFLFL